MFAPAVALLVGVTLSPHLHRAYELHQMLPELAAWSRDISRPLSPRLKAWLAAQPRTADDARRDRQTEAGLVRDLVQYRELVQLGETINANRDTMRSLRRLIARAEAELAEVRKRLAADGTTFGPVKK